MTQPAEHDKDGKPAEPGRYLEIKERSARSVRAVLAYVLFFAGVAGLLIFLLMRLGTAFGLAAGVVTFMVGYMAWMGYQASKDIHK